MLSRLIGNYQNSNPLGALNQNSLIGLISADTTDGYKSYLTSYASLPSQLVTINGNTTWATNPTIGDATADATTLAVKVNGNLTINAEAADYENGVRAILAAKAVYPNEVAEEAYKKHTQAVL